MLTFTKNQIQEWIAVSPSGNTSESISAIAVDSRHAIPGSVFVALPGAKTDGHLFLQAAARNGARFAIVEEKYSGESFGMELWHVPDTLLALQRAAQKWRKMSQARVIAITGSLGKTTTKGFVYQILKSKFKTGTSSGSKNSQIGLSLALLNETIGDEEFLVLEMGMTEPGQIRRLTEIAPPDIAVITEIALVHAAGFSSIEGIAEAKSEIFTHSNTKLGIYNRDIGVHALLKKGDLPKKTYSRIVGNGFWSLEVRENALLLHEDGKSYTLPFRDFPADHVYTNLLAAIAVAREVGMSIDEIGAVLSDLTLPERRLEELTKNGIHFINDCYNASLPSMKGAFQAMKKRKVAGRKIGLLGGIRELGVHSQQCHLEVGSAALEALDHVICIGSECEPLVQVWQKANRSIEWCETFEELVLKAKAQIQEGDLVLLKGSRSFQLERVLESF